MRIVALEEHFTVPQLVRRIDPDAIARHGFPAGFAANLADKLSISAPFALARWMKPGSPFTSVFLRPRRRPD